MKSGFKDYFSFGSDAYSIFRPGYPKALFVYLSGFTPSHERAWDCATGSGQSALALSEYYKEVIATDASKSQIENASRKSGIIYKTEKAEDTSIEDSSVDLITVAQALHWFDIQAFSKEVERVLKRQGIVAAWTYGLLNINPEIDKLVNHLYRSVLEDYWPPERRMVEDGYVSVSLPFEELESTVFQMRTEWSLDQLLGYLHTWSAVKKYEQQNGLDPVTEMTEELSAQWGETSKKQLVLWPLALRMWRKGFEAQMS